MVHASKSHATFMIGGAVAASLIALAAPLAWSQIASPSAGGPTTVATAPATVAAPAATGDAPATTVPAHHGLHFVADDPETRAMALNAFKAMGNSPTFAKEAPAMANFDALTFSPALPLYSLSVADITNASLPTTRGLTIYLAMANRKAVSYVEIATDAGGKPSMRSIGTGSSYPTIMGTIDAVKNNPTVQKGAYEARILTSAFIGGFSGPQDLLWLKADPGGTDLFVVPGGTSFEHGKLYDATAFFKILADNMAKQQANPPRRRG